MDNGIVLAHKSHKIWPIVNEPMEQEILTYMDQQVWVEASFW